MFVRALINCTKLWCLIVRYHSTYFGKLIGLESIVAALFALLQDPLFVCINSKFGGDPFWVSLTFQFDEGWHCFHLW